MTKRELGKRIKARREFLEWSQEKLANAFGVKQSTVSQYESGERGLEATELARLAGILEVDVAYFYGEGEYHEDDVPPEMKMVHGMQGKVLNHLPPGKARDRYIEKLRNDAEHNWEMLLERLDREEGPEASR